MQNNNYTSYMNKRNQSKVQKTASSLLDLLYCKNIVHKTKRTEKGLEVTKHLVIPSLYYLKMTGTQSKDNKMILDAFTEEYFTQLIINNALGSNIKDQEIFSTIKASVVTSLINEMFGYSIKIR